MNNAYGEAFCAFNDGVSELIAAAQCLAEAHRDKLDLETVQRATTRRVGETEPTVQ